MKHWTSFMQNTTSDYLKSFFDIYLRYIEAELPSSLFESSVGRNIDTLILFQDTFIFLMTAKKDINNAKLELDALFEQLKEAVAEYVSEAQFKPQNKLRIAKVDTAFFDEELKKLLEEYRVAYKDFLQYLPKLKLSNEILKRFRIHKKGNVLVQAILEFNNALAHIANALYRNNEDQLHNIKKAKNHLYRAILDYYKMLLRFMMPNITADNLVQTYQELRLDEFLLLGEDITNKTKKGQTITNRYKELFNECLMKIVISRA